MKVDDAIGRLAVHVAHEFRNRRTFSSCRGTVARSKRTSILLAREDRLELMAVCKALRFLRNAHHLVTP